MKIVTIGSGQQITVADNCPDLEWDDWIYVPSQGGIKHRVTKQDLGKRILGVVNDRAEKVVHLNGNQMDFMAINLVIAENRP